jgi:hypothetical protein
VGPPDGGRGPGAAAAGTGRVVVEIKQQPRRARSHEGRRDDAGRGPGPKAARKPAAAPEAAAAPAEEATPTEKA